jgi:histidyl-tRNA synthetase
MIDVRDAAPAEAAKWRFVRRRCVASFQAHGYREVQPAPIDPAGSAERAGLTERLPLDDGSELRADLQASIARLFAATAQEKFARWFTAGNAFDPEPVGFLRWRAWHGVSGLVIGAQEPAADAEVVTLLAALRAELGLRDGEIVIGTMGEPADGQRFLDATAELRGLRCGVCRAQSDPLRFLTCDDEGCRALAASAPPFRDFVGIPGLKHHEAVLATLEASGFTVRDDPRLAFSPRRYQRTVIELRAAAEDGTLVTVARGGRRDHLLPSFGAAKLPAVGVTLGVARAAACTPGDNESWEQRTEVFIAARGTAARAWALKAAAVERARGFRVDVDLREVGWAEQLQRADQVRARVVLVVGEVERKKGEVAIRDMQTRETRNIPEETLSAELKRLLR